MKTSKAFGYEQYEVSNFCKPGHISKEMTNEKAFTKNKSSISKEILLDRAVFHLLMNNHAKWDVMSYAYYDKKSEKCLSKI